jgi:hypothetical protein
MAALWNSAGNPVRITWLVQRPVSGGHFNSLAVGKGHFANVHIVQLNDWCEGICGHWKLATGVTPIAASVSRCMWPSH